MDKLEAILNSYREEMVETLAELVRIPSVDAEALPGMPFGKECARALDYALGKAKSFGFETFNDENYAGHAQFGDGERTLGVLAHLDVVPVGSGWTMPPFEAIVRDGYMYGRGVTDNKNSCVSCLYALRAIKEAGIPLGDRVRLIMGCNEEKGSADMAHYMKYVGMPDYGFSPDSGFPVCYAEKGIHRVELSAELDGESMLMSIRAGQAVNVVPDVCTAQLRAGEEIKLGLEQKAQKLGIVIDISHENGVVTVQTHGKSSHGAWPSGGVNAASLMVQLLGDLPLGGAQKAVDMLQHNLGVNDWDGGAMGVSMKDEPSGELTCNLGVLRIDEKRFTAQLDIRQPVTSSFDAVLSGIQAACAPFGVEARSIHLSDPLYVPKDSDLVKTLMKVYKDITGRDDQPFSMGGGTYARSMHNAVAFGPSLPDSKSGGAHGPDERLYIEELFTAASIYAHTIVALAGEKQA